MELIEKLGIDVKLLLTQIVTFTVLLTILTYLLYKPILNLLDKRKAMIEKNVEDTRRIEERLAQLEKERAEVLAEASKKAMAVIEQAKVHGEDEREKILANTKKEVSMIATRYRAELNAEKTQMVREVKKEVAELIVKSCEKILRKEFVPADQKRLEQAIKDELAGVRR